MKKPFHNDIEAMTHAQLAEYVERLKLLEELAYPYRTSPYHAGHYDAIAERLDEAQIALGRIEKDIEDQGPMNDDEWGQW